MNGVKTNEDMFGSANDALNLLAIDEEVSLERNRCRAAITCPIKMLGRRWRQIV